MYGNIFLISNVDGNLPLPDWIGASAGWKTMHSLGASFATPLPASATCLAASSSCIRISAAGQNRNAIPRRRARIPPLGRWRRGSEQGTILPSWPPSPSPAAAVQRSPTAAPPLAAAYEERFSSELLPSAGNAPLRFVLVAIGLGLDLFLDVAEDWWPPLRRPAGVQFLSPVATVPMRRPGWFLQNCGYVLGGFM